MIVRIVGLGQFRMDDEALRELNELDNEVVRAVDANDEAAFTAALERMTQHVQDRGEHLGDEELTPSDYILPPVDSTIDEVREDFAGEGLIPG